MQWFFTIVNFKEKDSRNLCKFIRIVCKMENLTGNEFLILVRSKFPCPLLAYSQHNRKFMTINDQPRVFITIE
jgi:hypothetical protein